MEDQIKIFSETSQGIALRVIPGHFATSHSHVNYFVDMTDLKVRQSEAQAVAKAMVLNFPNTTIVDTIVCMDGCEAIGAYLAQELTNANFQCTNAHKTIYIVTPEYNSNGQLVFLRNVHHTIMNKHVLILTASATTGKTIRLSVECVEYHGGIIEGISAIFSAEDEVDGHDVKSIFKSEDIPEYKSYSYSDCPYCKKHIPINAIVNSFGFSNI